MAGGMFALEDIQGGAYCPSCGQHDDYCACSDQTEPEPVRSRPKSTLAGLGEALVMLAVGFWPLWAFLTGLALGLRVGQIFGMFVFIALFAGLVNFIKSV